MDKKNDGLEIKKNTLIKYTGTAEKVVLPSTVTRIAPYSFLNCKTIKKLVTTTSLTSIGKGAFFGCENLKEAIIPGRLFKRVKGKKVFNNSSAIYFRFYASQGIVDEDEDVSDIYETEEEYYADVNSVEALLMAQGDDYDDADGFPLPTGRPDDAESLREKIDAITPEGPGSGNISDARRDKLVNLQDFLIEDDVLVKYIGSKKQVTVPDFIKKIGENAFANTEVNVVRLNNGLEIIGKGAFAWCDHLVSMVFPQTLKLIDDFAFSECSSLFEIILPASVTCVGANAFHACSSANLLELSPSLEVIGRRAFDFCVALEKVTIPDGIKVLNEGAFSHCEALRKVTLPQSLKEVGDWAFAECYELRDIVLPLSLERIGDVAFFNCRSMIALDIPASVKNLGRQTFVGCTGLNLVNMSKNLEKQIKPQKTFHGLKELRIEFYEQN